MTRYKPLTQMQYDFVKHYVSNGMNAYQAAVAAGFSETYADTKVKLLLDNPNIKPRIEKALQRVDDRLANNLGLTYEWKAKKLKRVIEEFIPNDKDEELSATKVKVGLTALAELNKMQGDYAPDKRLSVTVDATKERLEQVKRQYEEY